MAGSVCADEHDTFNERLLRAQTGHPAFSRPAGQPNLHFSNLVAPNRPLATSPNRPKGDGRGSHPISILKASSGLAECPLFSEQIDAVTAPTLPEPITE